MIRAFEPTRMPVQSGGSANFSDNGVRVILADECTVQRELSGDCTAELKCRHEYADALACNALVVIDTPEGAEPFRVRDFTDTGKKIECRCMHVFHDTEKYAIYGFNEIPEGETEPEPYHDTAVELAKRIVNIAETYSETNPMPFGIRLIGTYDPDGYDLLLDDCSLKEALEKLAETIGAVMTYQGWIVTLTNVPSGRSEALVEYRKNLKGIEATYDASEVCTRLIGIGDDDVTITGLYMDCTDPRVNLPKYDIAFTRIEHFSQDDVEKGESESDEAYHARVRAALELQMIDWLKDHHYPNASYSIDIISAGLDIAGVKVNEQIQVRDQRIGLDGLFTVRATTYDAVKDHLSNIELGAALLSLKGVRKKMTSALTMQMMGLASGIAANAAAMSALSDTVTTLDGDKQDKVLISAGGNKYTIGVDNDGNLTTTPVVD